MRTQLRLFLARFNDAIADYSLARLETALRNPTAQEPPLLQRLGKGAFGSKALASWPQISRRVEALGRYSNALRKGKIRLDDERTRASLLAAARRVIELRNSIEALHAELSRGRVR